MRYNHFTMLPERAFQKRPFGGMTLEGGSGGGSSAPTQTTVQNTSIPEYAQPYVENMLGATQQQLFNLDSSGQITGIKPYVPYSTDPTAYIAGFSPMQQQAFSGASNLGLPSQYGAASGATSAAMQRALQAGYTPGQFSMLSAQAPELEQYQMGGPQNVEAQQVGTPLMGTAQTGYRPDLQMFQMGPAGQVSTGSFADPYAAQAYMSPYVQQALAPQLSEIQRQSDITQQGLRAQALASGAFGGSRQALQASEQERNKQALMSQATGQGYQNAYQQAMQQYSTDAARQLAAQQANQQAGLTVGGQNLAAALGVQQLGTQTGLQTALANLSSAQQANVQNQAAQLQAQGMNAQQALQAALANQQAGITVGGQNLQALLGVQQLGAGQNLQAQLANQQAYQTAQQLAEQSRQYGAGYGMQGLQTALSGANQLAGIGGQSLQSQLGILGLQQQYGSLQQQQQQNIINQAIQNYATAQQYPEQQLAFMNAMLRGLPLQTATTQSYQASPSYLSQLSGLGTAAYGGYKLFGGKKGGLPKDFEKTYAGGGITDINRKVLMDPEKYSQQTLQRGIQNNVVNPMVGRLAMAENADFAQRAQNAQAGVNQAGISQANINPQMFSAAGGGIVAFASGDLVEDEEDDEDALDKSYAAQHNALMNALIAGYKNESPDLSMLGVPAPSRAMAPAEGKGITAVPSASAPVSEGIAATAPAEGITIASAKEEHRAGVKVPSGHKYEKEIIREAERLGISPELATKIAMLESGGARNPEKAVSRAGAKGVMQLMPGTAKEMGVKDITDPEQNIRAGLGYFKRMLDKYGDPKIAGAAYNWGPGNVDRWLRTGANPDKLPAETRKYIASLKEGGEVKRFANGDLIGGVPLWEDIEGTTPDVMPRSKLVEKLTLPELQEYNRSGYIPERLRGTVGKKEIGAVPLFGTTAAPSRATAPKFGVSPKTAAARPAPVDYETEMGEDPYGLKSLGVATPVGSSLAAAAAATPESAAAKPDEYSDYIKRYEDRLGKQRQEDKYMAILAAGLGMMGGTSPHALTNIGSGAMKGVEAAASFAKERGLEERGLLRGRLEQSRAREAADVRKDLAAEQRKLNYSKQLGSLQEKAIADALARRKVNTLNDLSPVDQASVIKEAQQYLYANPGFQDAYKQVYGTEFILPEYKVLGVKKGS